MTFSPENDHPYQLYEFEKSKLGSSLDSYANTEGTLEHLISFKVKYLIYFKYGNFISIGSCHVA